MEWNHNSMMSLLQAYLIDMLRVWSQKFLVLQDHILSFICLQLHDIHGSLVLPESLSYHSVWHHKTLHSSKLYEKRQRKEGKTKY